MRQQIDAIINERSSRHHPPAFAASKTTCQSRVDRLTVFVLGFAECERTERRLLLGFRHRHDRQIQGRILRDARVTLRHGKGRFDVRHEDQNAVATNVELDRRTMLQSTPNDGEATVGLSAIDR